MRSCNASTDKSTGCAGGECSIDLVLERLRDDLNARAEHRDVAAQEQIGPMQQSAATEQVVGRHRDEHIVLGVQLSRASVPENPM